MSLSLFTRVELLRDVPAAALRQLLVPTAVAARTVSSHRLIWTLFGDSADRERDFLWREHAPGVFYVLSDRPPRDTHGLFRIEPPLEFSPALSPGDRLSFEVRVNATVSRGGKHGVRGKRCDVVMDAIYSARGAGRAEARRAVVDRVASEWMTRQGLSAGFELEALEVLGYSAIRHARNRGNADATMGVLDLRGSLAVREPASFLRSLRSGIGRSRAFGCGLMLIKRA